jgi:hypothetical protein
MPRKWISTSRGTLDKQAANVSKPIMRSRLRFP